MSDAPDFTLAGHVTLIGTVIMLPIDVQGSTIMMPIDIQGQTVNVAIDIAAQSIGNIKVDIAAQSIGNLGIDIKAQTLSTLNINISSQSAFNLNVNLAASAITLNVAITSSVQLNVNIAASAVTLNVSITSSAVTLNVNISSQSAFNLNVNLAASAITLNVAITSSITLNVAIQSSAVTLNVAIQSSAVTLNVNISSQSAFNLNVNIAASAVTLNVAIQSSAVTLNVAIQSSAVTLNVSVQSSIAINIQTSGGTNIIIDKLVQAAFTARSVNVRNDNGVTTPTAPPDYDTGVNYVGKFFPRGCRGMVDWISIYCKRTASGTLTLKVAPAPGMGEIWSLTITPGAAWNWVSATVDKMWEYDSMFVYVSACSGDVSYGLDDTTPYDSYSSADSGVTWGSVAYRHYIWVGSRGQTVGDLPVSGTINTIEVPNLASGTSAGVANVASGVETSLLTIGGSGRVNRTAFQTSHDAVEMRFYIDGVMVDEDSLLSYMTFRPVNLNTAGYTASTPQIQLLQWASAGTCRVSMQVEFKFKRSFEVRTYHSTGVTQSIYVGVIYEVLS